MVMGEKKVLDEETLKAVSGGGFLFDEKYDEFNEAWNQLGMDKKGCSGMTRSIYFEEWMDNGCRPDAVTFLQSK